MSAQGSGVIADCVLNRVGVVGGCCIAVGNSDGLRFLMVLASVSSTVEPEIATAVTALATPPELTVKAEVEAVVEERVSL